MTIQSPAHGVSGDADVSDIESDPGSPFESESDHALPVAVGTMTPVA